LLFGFDSKHGKGTTTMAVKTTPRNSFLNGLTQGLLFAAWVSVASAVPPEAQLAASSTAVGTTAAGAVDGDRFSVDAESLWKGESGEEAWWWQIRFAQPQPVGAILQVNGDHSAILRNAPRRYVWQWSEDGRAWHGVKETETRRERRLFRIHRLASARKVRYLRMLVSQSVGDAPSLREVEFYDDPCAEIEFGDWIVSVSTAESAALPGGTGAFVSLARQCSGWESVLAQQTWIGDFDEEFVAAEPYPLCAFLTGNYREWCQRTREPWRGVEEVVANRNLPIWGACGGAQAMAILEETGVDKPWDCPRCRDPQAAKSPVYTHIGHTGPASCGDYSKSIGERGKFKVRRTAQDPAFEGLPEVFEIMESHIGQIAWPPKGWVRVATKGPGALTVNQCLRVEDRYIYAAQFHMELAGTPENSRRIMGNFLALAREWGGYNPKGKSVPRPEPLAK